MIIVRCVCGNQREFDDIHRGRTTRCPQCAALLKIGGEVVAQPAMPAVPLPPPALLPPVPRSSASSVVRAPTAVRKPTAVVNPFAFSKPAAPLPSASAPPEQPSPRKTLTELRGRPLEPTKPRASASSALTAATESTPAKPPGPNTALLFGPGKKKKDENVLYELRYWLLSLALAPLIMSLFQTPDNVKERYERTLENLPREAQEKLMNGRLSERKLFSVLPDERIEGALLPHSSWMHWGFACVSCVFFVCVILGLFPRGNAEAGKILLAGLFTGTVGIFFLLVVQYIAIFSAATTFSGGKLGIIFIILRVIGFSYNCAFDPNTGFAASFFGFIFGVGLCEELCKGFTLLIHFKGKATLDWRGACVWGLACGVGFGISEGIMYSSGHYNGIHTGGIYLIRFISCVALHGIWSAATGISFYRHRFELQAASSLSGLFMLSIKAILAPMVMHGAYDTLLKEDMPGGAVLVAIAGFGWLAYQIERAYVAKEDEPIPQVG